MVLLMIVAVAGDDSAYQVVHRDDGGGGAVAGGDLLAGDGERAVVEARAAPLLGDGDAEEAHRRQRAQLVLREVLLTVPARRMRGEPLGRETAYRLADLLKMAGHRSRYGG